MAGPSKRSNSRGAVEPNMADAPPDRCATAAASIVRPARRACITVMSVMFWAWHAPHPPAGKYGGRRPLEQCDTAVGGGARRGRHGGGKARWPGTRRWRSGALQERDGRRRSRLPCPVERGLTVRRSYVQPGAPSDEQLHDLDVAVVGRHRVHQGRHPASLDGVDVGAGIDERFHDADGAVGRSQNERREPAEPDDAVLDLAALGDR